MKLFILFVSYTLVHCIENRYHGGDWSTYWFMLAVSSFLMIILCVLICRGTFNLHIFGYGVLQVLMLLCYYKLIDPVNNIAYLYVVYDSIISISLIVLMYELTLLIDGLRNGYNAYIGYHNDRCIRFPVGTRTI